MFDENVRVSSVLETYGKTRSLEIKKELYKFTKRAFDIVASTLGLIILFPILLIVALLIKIDSKGPVFIDQKRIGKNGKLFKIYKFRSMVDNAEEVLFKMMEEDTQIREEYMTNKKLKNDPRITRVGKFIRKTSIDELPQLINIFLGNMTIVGPRPYLAMEIPDMGGSYNTIIKMVPGLTGPWQVSGRSDVGFQDRCKIDVRYYFRRSLKVDFKIMLKTFSAVLSRKGAK